MILPMFEYACLVLNSGLVVDPLGGADLIVDMEVT